MGDVAVLINGETKCYDENTLFLEIANTYQEQFEYDIIAVFRNDKVHELNKAVKSDCELKFITTDTVIGNNIYIRGISMMLLKAIYHVIDSSHIDKVCIEATIGNGYYCELVGKEEIDDEKLLLIEERMNVYVDRNITFEKKSIPTDEVIKLFAEVGMTDKEKLFKYRRASRVNVYSLDGFYDYFYGAMPPNTGMLKYFSLKRYGSGFVFIVPGAKEPKSIKEFVSSPKFYSIVKESNDWGRTMGVEDRKSVV